MKLRLISSAYSISNNQNTRLEKKKNLARRPNSKNEKIGRRQSSRKLRLLNQNEKKNRPNSSVLKSISKFHNRCHTRYNVDLCVYLIKKLHKKRHTVPGWKGSERTEMVP